MHKPKRNIQKKRPATTMSHSQPLPGSGSLDQHEMDTLLNSDHTTNMVKSTIYPSGQTEPPNNIQEPSPNSGTTKNIVTFDPDTFKQDLLATIRPGSIQVPMGRASTSTINNPIPNLTPSSPPYSETKYLNLNQN